MKLRTEQCVFRAISFVECFTGKSTCWIRTLLLEETKKIIPQFYKFGIATYSIPFLGIQNTHNHIKLTNYLTQKSKQKENEKCHIVNYSNIYRYPFQHKLVTYILFKI